MGNTRKSKLNYIIKNIKTLGEDVLNPLMSEIIEYHLISAFLNKPRVPKWSNRMKKFCADLYHKSPSAYSYLQKTLTLPTKKTILKFIVDRIQIAKNETFKQNISQQNDKQMDCSVDERVDKFNDQEMIIASSMDVLLSNNDLNNITIEYNSCEESNGELIGVTTIGSHPNCDDSGRVLTTQITLIDDSSPSMTGADQ